MLINTLLVLISILQPVRLSELFLLARASVEDGEVMTETRFNYELTIGRDQGTKVEKEDYLIIALPDDATARWNIDSEPECDSATGTVLRCEILSEQQAMVVFDAQQNLVLRGSISNFINPDSVNALNGIGAQLFTRRDELKVIASQITIQDFYPQSAEVHLTSSSAVVGDERLQLYIRVIPDTSLSHKGFMVLNVPDYYEDAGQDYFFSQKNPEPCTFSKGEILSCKFSQRQMQLVIEYEFNPKFELHGEANFTASYFRNPVTETQGGFHLEILDEDEMLVATSDTNVYMEGISVPAIFSKHIFNFVDTAASIQYATHQFILDSAVSV